MFGGTEPKLTEALTNKVEFSLPSKENSSQGIYLFSASAGSGKTYSLAKIFLQELAKKVNLTQEEFKDLPYLSQILVLTFTNKAAFEMKERIYCFLEEIALRQGRGPELGNELNINEETAEKLLEYLLLHFDKLRISTIDSYLYRLFRGLAYEHGLPVKLKVEKKIPDKLIEEALIKFYLRSVEEPDLIDFLKELISFVVEEEEEGFIQVKKRLVKGLQEHIEDTVRGKIWFEEDNNFLTSLLGQERIPYKRGRLYRQLYQHLKKHLEEVLLEKGIIYMGFWKEKLKKHLDEEGLPWIYFKLGRVGCLMMDESQDTDILQFENLLPLLENLLAEGGPIYFAWDPKQSIYRWRGANPDYLTQLIEDLKKRKYPQVSIPLIHNHRSCINLVTFNNFFFKKLYETSLPSNFLRKFLENKDIPKEDKFQILWQEIEENFCHKLKKFYQDVEQVGKRSYNGTIVVHTYWEEKKYQNNQSSLLDCPKFFNLIEEILDELDKLGELKNTAVLLRDNQTLRDLYQYLLHKNKNYFLITQVSSTLENSPLILGLMAYLRLLVNPEDEVALVQALSTLFPEEGSNLLNEYLNFKAETKNPKLRLKDYLEKFHQEFLEEKILKPLKEGEILSPYGFFQYLWQKFQLKVKFKEEISYFYVFLSHILKKEKQGYSLVNLLETLPSELKDKELPLPNACGNSEKSIYLITIHSAKGLEFDNVITYLDFLKSRPDYSSFPVRLKTKEGIFMGREKELKSEEEWLEWIKEKSNQLLESINLMYVCFTRAKKRLYLILPLKRDKGVLKTTNLTAFVFSKILEELEREKIILSETQGLVKYIIPSPKS